MAAPASTAMAACGRARRTRSRTISPIATPASTACTIETGIEYPPYENPIPSAVAAAAAMRLTCAQIDPWRRAAAKASPIESAIGMARAAV